MEKTLDRDVKAAKKPALSAKQATAQEEHMYEQTERLRGLYEDFAKVEQQVRSAV
jgi:hypothetical protein